MSRKLICLIVEATRLARGDGGELAGVGGTLGDGLGLAAGLGALELLADLLDAGSAGGAVDGGGVAEVGVDADEELAAVGLDVLDDNVALGALLAVSAGAVELAEVGDLEAVDGDGTGTVVLDDLVLSASGTTTGDGGVTVLLEGESVLADGGPPDVLESAGTLAVDTLNLVLADDDVLESGTVSQREDGVRIATLGLTSAADTTAVGLQATVEGARDLLDFLEGLGALAGGDGDAGALGQAGEAARSLVGGAGGGHGGESQDGSSDGSLHFDGG
ncbi:hypothetical protein OPT61_g2028 [Boeremia exigua]|uniref:Uncharacterized protein n=1 Tax=Boeremia exigua TaxID=749465 RepID=A0ACC2IN00_9PLEO|nr:hypothetical protein OPT61_g2028 [Boeremia exigua]